MKFISVVALVSILLCCQVNAQRSASTRAYDVILEALGFGPCTDQPQRCGYRDRGYKMIKINDDKGLCSEICSTTPYLNVGYQCGTCERICPESATIPCLQGIGMKMFRVDNDGSCEDFCLLSSTQADGYSCGECNNSAPSTPVASPISQPLSLPITPPTRRPVAITPIRSPVPVTSPITLPVPISLPVAPITPPVTVTSAPMTPPVPIANPTSLRYDITMQLVDVSNDDSMVFEQAAALWESAVIGDIPDIESSEFEVPPFLDACIYPTIVDDLFICGTVTNIDGFGNIAGSARPTSIRSADEGNLPATGEMRFDLADIDDLRAKGLLIPLVAHEMGHILGIGSNWEFLGVTGTDAENCPYMGQQATEEYRTLSGCDVIPTEQEGAVGSRCRHWSETCLASELMTTALDEGSNPMSRVTIGGLADLGYTVDYTNAAVFTKDDLDPSCLCNNRKDRQLLRQPTNNASSEDSLFHGKHGDVVLLDNLITGQSRRKNQERRQLSESLRQQAISYGLQVLDESAARTSWASAVLDLRNGEHLKRNQRKPKKVRYAGHYYISVIMKEGDSYFGVLVVRDESE